MTKPQCIYIASRISALPPVVKEKKDVKPVDYVFAYIYNVRESIKAAAAIWRKGHYVFMPSYDLLVYLELDDPLPPHPYEADLEWIRRCDAFLLLNGLEESSNVRREYEEAVKTSKIIYKSIDEIPEVDE